MNVNIFCCLTHRKRERERQRDMCTFIFAVTTFNPAAGSVARSWVISIIITWRDLGNEQVSLSKSAVTLLLWWDSSSVTLKKPPICSTKITSCINSRRSYALLDKIVQQISKGRLRLLAFLQQSVSLKVYIEYSFYNVYDASWTIFKLLSEPLDNQFLWYLWPIYNKLLVRLHSQFCVSFTTENQGNKNKKTLDRYMEKVNWKRKKNYVETFVKMPPFLFQPSHIKKGRIVQLVKLLVLLLLLTSHKKEFWHWRYKEKEHFSSDFLLSNTFESVQLYMVEAIITSCRFYLTFF